MSEKIKIRDAVMEDLDSILDLSCKLFKNDSQFDGTLDPEWNKREGRDYFTRRIQEDDDCAFVAFVDEEIVGYLTGVITSSESYRIKLKIADLSDMFVLEDYRNQGVGSRLCQEFNDWAESKNVDRLKVVASAGNQKAREFYERSEFEDYDVTLEKNLK